MIGYGKKTIISGKCDSYRCENSENEPNLQTIDIKRHIVAPKI